MANTNADSSLEILVVLKRIADKIGVNKLKAHLTDLERTSVANISEKSQTETIKTVCSVVGIHPKELKSSAKHKTEARYWGIRFVSVILSKKGGLSARHIGGLFDLQEKTIRNYIYEVNKLDIASKFDKEKLEQYSKIEKEIDLKKIFANPKN